MIEVEKINLNKLTLILNDEDLDKLSSLLLIVDRKENLYNTGEKLSNKLPNVFYSAIYNEKLRTIEFEEVPF